MCKDVGGVKKDAADECASTCPVANTYACDSTNANSHRCLDGFYVVKRTAKGKESIKCEKIPDVKTDQVKDAISENSFENCLAVQTAFSTSNQYESIKCYKCKEGMALMEMSKSDSRCITVTREDLKHCRAGEEARPNALGRVLQAASGSLPEMSCTDCDPGYVLHHSVSGNLGCVEASKQAEYVHHESVAN